MLTSYCLQQPPCDLEAQQQLQLPSHINPGQDVLPEILPTPPASEPRVSVTSENTSPIPATPVTVTDTLVKTPPVPPLHR